MMLVRVRAPREPREPDKPENEDVVVNDVEEEEEEEEKPVSRLRLILRFVQAFDPQVFIHLFMLLVMVIGCAIITKAVFSMINTKHYVGYDKWADRHLDMEIATDDPAPYKEKYLIFVHTDSELCEETVKCRKLLNILREREQRFEYNFLISSNELIYQGLSWVKISTMFNDCQGIVLAFIGNFTESSPGHEQFRLMNKLIGDLIYRGYLDRHFDIVGKRIRNDSIPIKLFNDLRETTSKWNTEFSVKY